MRDIAFRSSSDVGKGSSWVAVKERGTYLVFKLIQRLGQNWRALNGGENLMALVLEGCVFEDGIRRLKPAVQPATSVA